MASPRTIRTLLIVDVVLVVALLIAAIAYLTGSGSPSAAPTGSGTGTAAAHAPGSTGATSFALPSGNIACSMTTAVVTCTIASITYAPPPAPKGCTGDTGHVITLDAHAVTFPCVAGPRPSVADTGVHVLEYGSTASVGEFTCASATDGVTCTNGSGVGFRLAKGSWSNIPDRTSETATHA